jgi:hypothetical protein
MCDVALMHENDDQCVVLEAERLLSISDYPRADVWKGGRLVIRLPRNAPEHDAGQGSGRAKLHPRSV